MESDEDRVLTAKDINDFLILRHIKEHGGFSKKPFIVERGSPLNIAMKHFQSTLKKGEEILEELKAYEEALEAVPEDYQ